MNITQTLPLQIPTSNNDMNISETIRIIDVNPEYIVEGVNNSVIVRADKMNLDSENIYIVCGS